MIDGTGRRLLVVDDDELTVSTLRRILGTERYEVSSAADGVAALHELADGHFDAVLIDWLMPHMDGVELVRRIREQHRPPPPLLFMTSHSSLEAERHARAAGADEFLGKPFSPAGILRALERVLRRQGVPTSAAVAPRAPARTAGAAPLAVVCVAASTGGPAAVTRLVERLRDPFEAAVVLVLHGPRVMLELLCARLRGLTWLGVALAREGQRLAPGHLYVAPADRHLTIVGDPPVFAFSDGPPENHARPSADPLFRSAAAALGPRSVGVILTGLGRDGAAGAERIAGAGGVVLVEDPATAIAPSMPETAIRAGLATRVAPAHELADILQTYVQRLTRGGARCRDEGRGGRGGQGE